MTLRDDIASLLEREGISQKVFAERVGVHQSTVSRALQRQPVRRSAAHARLQRFMHDDAGEVSPPDDPALDALRETWDGSERHAAALATLIRASRELWPELQKEAAS